MTRAINRRKWDKLELERALADLSGTSGVVFHEYLRRLRIRRQVRAFHPDAQQQVIELDDESFGVLGVGWR